MADHQTAHARKVYQSKVEALVPHLDVDKYGEDWEKRFNALKKLQELVVRHAEPLKGEDALLHEVFTVDSFRCLGTPLENQLKDLRSAIVREACKV